MYENNCHVIKFDMSERHVGHFTCVHKSGALAALVMFIWNNSGIDKRYFVISE